MGLLMDTDLLVAALRNEIDRTVGCTDPVSISLAVAAATHALGVEPESIEVTTSPYLFKNAIRVGIPGTGTYGMPLAAALGALVAAPEKRLALLEDITPEQIAQARQWVKTKAIRIAYSRDVESLYIRAEVSAAGQKAAAVIAGDYDHILEIRRGDQVLHANPALSQAPKDAPLLAHSVQEWLRVIDQTPPEKLLFLLEAARVNKAAAEYGLQHPEMQLGPALLRQAQQSPSPAACAQALTAAAAEARMQGLIVPVMAFTGSGNQGITNFLGVLAVAESLNCSAERTVRALAVASLITAMIKTFSGRMTSFCAAAIAAAAGVAAGTVTLLDGDYAQLSLAVQSVVGTYSGMLCDGAKVSCAYKIGASVYSAVQFAYLAMQGIAIPAATGIIGNDLEEIFTFLGELNRTGMRATEGFMLQIIEQYQR